MPMAITAQPLKTMSTPSTILYGQDAVLHHLLIVHYIDLRKPCMSSKIYCARN